MKKQTKLVAVLSTAALLAIGAFMTSFAATGWAEEDGTWVYYNRDGEMAVDQLIEDGDNYYYVDINGVMAANQWVAIENEDAGEDDSAMRTNKTTVEIDGENSIVAIYVED